MVVHSAVERKPDVVEKQEEEARKINVSATETIAKTCGKLFITHYLSFSFFFFQVHSNFQTVKSTGNLVNQFNP